MQSMNNQINDYTFKPRKLRLADSGSEEEEEHDIGHREGQGILVTDTLRQPRVFVEDSVLGWEC